VPSKEQQDVEESVPSNRVKKNSDSMPVNCFRNDHVDKFHGLLTASSIKFPVPMDKDVTKEVASWAKSLFLSGKIGKKEKKHFMLTTRSSVKPDLKALAKVVGVKELRLASPADVSSILHIEKGCVTAMTSVMDKDCKVTCCLDEGLMEATNLRMCAGCNDALDHSQHNISLCPSAELRKLLEDSGHNPLMLDFSGGGPAVKITSGSVQASAPAPAAAAPAKKEKKQASKQKPEKKKKTAATTQAAPAASGQTAERTYIMVKPDGVQRGCVGEIVSRFETKGFKLCALQLRSASAAMLSEHYSDLKSKGFFASLVDFMSSAPVVAMVWEGAGVVAEGRKMLGATMPSDSEMGTIRGDLCIDIGRNICHGSDSVESAAAEIGLWLSDDVSLVVEWAHHTDEWINEEPLSAPKQAGGAKSKPSSAPAAAPAAAPTATVDTGARSSFTYPIASPFPKTQLPNKTFQFPLNLKYKESRCAAFTGPFSYPIKIGTRPI
jgi:nucleoside-diphosphate kinase